MDDQAILFELLLQTNIPQTASEISAQLTDVKASLQEVTTTAQTMGTAVETGASTIVASASKEVAAIQSVNRELEKEAELTARTNQMIADMQARRASGTPLNLPNTASSAETQAMIAAGQGSGGFNPPPLPPTGPSFPGEGTPLDFGGMSPYSIGIGQQAEQATLGIRGMRLEMMAFGAAGMLAATEVEGALGKDAQASEAVRVATEAMRVAMTMVMLSSMGLGAGMMVATGGLLAVAAAIPIVIELLNKQRDALAENITKTDPYIQSLQKQADGNAALADSLKKLAQAQADAEIANQRAAAARSGDFVTQAIFNTLNKNAQQELANQQAVVFGLASGYDQLENSVRGVSSAEKDAQGANVALAIQMQLGKDAVKQAADGFVPYEEALQKILDLSGLGAKATGDLVTQLNDAYIASAQFKDAFNRTTPVTTADFPLTQDQIQLMENQARANGTGWVAQWNKGADEQYQKDQTQLQQDAQRRGEQEAQAFMTGYNNAIKSIATAAIQPTSVTAGDQAATAAGTYTNKWDEAARRLQGVKEAGAASPWANAENWKDMAPPPGLVEAFAKGDAAIKAFAASEIEAFYNGQRIGEIDLSGLKTSVDSQITGVIGKFELLQQAEATARTELENLQKTDPAKYQEFLKAENLAPSTSAQDAAKTAFGNVAKSVDPAQKAVSTYATTISNIPATKTTTAVFEDKQALTDLAGFETELDKFIAKYGGIDVSVSASLKTPAVPSNGGTRNPGFSMGGVGIFPRDMAINVHEGEGFWISGQNWQVPPPGSPLNQPWGPWDFMRWESNMQHQGNTGWQIDFNAQAGYQAPTDALGNAIPGLRRFSAQSVDFASNLADSGGASAPSRNGGGGAGGRGGINITNNIIVADVRQLAGALVGALASLSGQMNIEKITQRIVETLSEQLKVAMANGA